MEDERTRHPDLPAPATAAEPGTGSDAAAADPTDPSGHDPAADSGTAEQVDGTALDPSGEAADPAGPSAPHPAGATEDGPATAAANRAAAASGSTVPDARWVAAAAEYALADPTGAADPTGSVGADAAIAARKAAALRAARGEDKLLPWLRENFEAVVVAFIMALVIRCFCIEVFKIPTGSMQPTLMGDPVTGDRIMVNKFLLHFVDLKRYDVAVFRYPLDSSRNFVKRVVGIGPEVLKLKEGDLYVRTPDEARFHLAKKPLEVQEAIWIPVFDSQFDLEHLLDKWTVSDDDAWRLSDGTLRLDATQAEDGDLRLHYNAHVTDFYQHNQNERGGSNWVGDVKLSAAFTLESGTGGVLFHLKNEPYEFTVRLALAGGSSVSYHNLQSTLETQRLPIKNVALERGRAYRAAVMIFDGTLCVTLDDRPVFQLDFIDEEDLTAGASFEKHIAFGVKDAVARVERLSIHRDLYYYGPRAGVLADGAPVEIPAGHFFMIGDNCPNSKDSRAWKRKWVRLTSGEIIEGDRDGDNERSNFSSEANGLMRIKDRHGVVRMVPEDSVVFRDEEFHKFVREEELVGRALLVWWPVARAKLIR